MAVPKTPLEAVWATHLHPPPPSKQGLTVDRIVQAAIAVADADGLTAVSMARVAADLGFTPMSLYRHITSKDDLLLRMQDRAVGPPPPDGFGEGDWRKGLQEWAMMIWAGLRTRPWVLQTIALFGPPATPNQVAWLDAGLQALTDVPLSEGEKMSAILLVNGHVLSDVLFTSAYTPTAPGAPDPADYGIILGRMLDPDRYPALMRAIAGGAFDADPDDSAEDDFAFRLERILDGIEQLVRQRADGAS